MSDYQPLPPLFQGLLGNARGVDPKQVAKDTAPLLVDGETVLLAYKLVRDLIIFTERRLILIDKQGLTGKKSQYHSIPYKNISHFSVETAGHLDYDAEMKIYLSGSQFPVEKTFAKGHVDIFEVQRALAVATLGHT